MKITIEVPEDAINDYADYHGYQVEIDVRDPADKRDTKKPNPQTKLEFFKQALERHIKHGVITRRRNEAERVAREAAEVELDLSVS